MTVSAGALGERAEVLGALTLVVGAGLGDGQRHPACDAEVGPFHIAELLLDRQLLQHAGVAAPRLGPVRHQIAGINEKVALLVFRQRPQGGDGVAGGGAVFAAFSAVEMPGTVYAHAVHQQQVRPVPQLQAGSIVKKLVVGVGIGAVKMAVGNGQGGVVCVSVAGGLKGVGVAQLAYPVVGRCGGL